jgi:hypothetical protein
MERGCCFSPKWVAEFGGILFFFNLKSGKQFFFVPINGHVKGRTAMIHILVFK